MAVDFICRLGFTVESVLGVAHFGNLPAGRVASL